MDSMLVYRGLDVVTAKPTAEERRRCELALVDVADPSESFSVAKFVAMAKGAELDIYNSGRVPLFVGGTGLYLKSLIHGIFESPPANATLRMQYSERAARDGVASLHLELAAVDAAAAAKIHCNDEKRIIRALEVFVTTGKPISHWQKEWGGDVTDAGVAAALRVEPEELLQRMSTRIEQMFQNGAVEEVRRAREAGLSREAGAAVGVREIVDLLDATISLEEAKARMLKRTRELARRQRTWYRSFTNLRWVDAGGARTVDEIAREVFQIFTEK